LRYLFSGDLSDDTETEVDPGCDAARGDDVAILNDAPLLMYGADHWQKSGEGPVRGGAASLEQAGDTEDECAGAHRGHILRCSSLPENELYRIAIIDRFDDARVAAGNADQIERRAICERMRRHQTKATVTRHGIGRLCNDMHGRLGQSGEHLLRTSEVE